MKSEINGGRDAENDTSGRRMAGEKESGERDIVRHRCEGGCARSRIDVCLIFNPDDPGSGGEKKEVMLQDALDVMKEARTKYLVTRPFRNTSRTETDGICFCCDDCCGYFLDPMETCDKGDMIAETDMDTCIHCGVCVEVCYFNARKMADNQLQVDLDACYGCGLCPTVCPVDCIQMIKR
jgi:Pyruvate/2-oxoacid:ferredoxin oxidoreductase delta subunit